jgi:predicted DNA-binding transcriptional regulator AlpA
MRREGEFPEPVKISKRRVAYPKQAIDDWIAERMEGYDNAA